MSYIIRSTCYRKGIHLLGKLCRNGAGTCLDARESRCRDLDLIHKCYHFICGKAEVSHQCDCHDGIVDVEETVVCYLVASSAFLVRYLNSTCSLIDIVTFIVILR